MKPFLFLIGILLIVFPLALADGSAVFMIRGVTVQDNTIYISQDGTPANLSYLPDHTEDARALNPGYAFAYTLPDGWSEPLPLPAGEYTAYLRQGNSDQPEEQRFVVGEGITRVVFLGAAYASGDEGCCACHNVTVIDVPGQIIHHQEINHTIMHPAGTEVVVVVDVPAWEEVIHHPGILHHPTCYPEVSYVMKQTYYYTNSKGWRVTTPWRNGTCPAFETIFPRMCDEERVIVSEAYCEPDWIVDIEEYDETIHHPEVNHTETRPVGEPWYEIVVDAPAWDEQVGAITHEERVCGQKLVCPCGCVGG